jgi:hypothetical protein
LIFPGLPKLAGLVLVEQGKLNFDDPVAKYLPQVKDLVVLEGLMTDPTKPPTPRPAQGVPTILHLLTHSSGSTYFAKLPEPIYALSKGYTFEQTGSRLQAQDEFLELIKVYNLFVHQVPGDATDSMDSRKDILAFLLPLTLVPLVSLAPDSILFTVMFF